MATDSGSVSILPSITREFVALTLRLVLLAPRLSLPPHGELSPASST